MQLCTDFCIGGGRAHAYHIRVVFFFQAEDGIRDDLVTGVQTCALPILLRATLAHRRLAALVCFGVMIAAIPIFKLVKVEYIPSDVDESEFEVNVTAPEGDRKSVV